MKRGVRWFGLLLFMGSLALLAWWWSRIASSPAAGDGWRAVPPDTALFSVFALHHSLLARTTAKRVIERLVPADLIRTAYVCTASLLLALVCLLWRRTGGEAYQATGAAAVALYLLQAGGLVVGVLAVRRISVLELAGVVAAPVGQRLEATGPYGLVRHPLYLSVVLLLAGTPQMTGDRLLFAALTTAYVIVAMPFEEAGLTAQFGSDYLEYRRAVRWRLIPYIH